ncbi:MAG TPA: DUF4595 domain-containing protein [Candidatus Bacteroides intestinigallinarum]|nr:DUF4595 domain-containing protein [Candidatus Bacteroides intestinigallinarum]
MKELKKRLLLALLLIGVAMASCSDGDGGVSKTIELTGDTQTTQILFADETTTNDGIKFTATEAWTATVSEVATTKAAAGRVDWIGLSAYSGGAGEFALTMILQPNLTGKDRKAEIRIVCGDITIVIVVEQKGTKEDGTTPESPDDPDVSTDKLITKIEIDNYTYAGEFDGTDIMEFTYDNQKRLTKMVETGVDETSTGEEIPTVTTIVFTYDNNKVSYEWTDVENGVISPYKPAGSITLDANGRAVSGTGRDYEYKDKVEEYTFTYTLEYNTDGYLIRSVRVVGNATSSDEERLTWTNGNLVSVWWGDGYGGDSNPDVIDRAQYGSVLNKTNLDLNWCVALNSEGFDFATGDTYKMFPMLGYTGKRSTNMAEKILAWTGGTSTKDDYRFEYTTDKDGFLTSIVEYYNYVISNEQSNWVKENVYRITYNK